MMKCRGVKGGAPSCETVDGASSGNRPIWLLACKRQHMTTLGANMTPMEFPKKAHLRKAPNSAEHNGENHLFKEVWTVGALI